MEREEPATVLVVDDNQELADLYADWLAPTYEVQTAYGGEEALARLDEAIDIVLLDRRMPGLSGDEVLERIRDHGLDCRVALVTSIDPEFDIVELGFDDYLRKPVTETTLHELVESLLTRARYSDRLREYAALVSTRATLQTEKSADELRENPDFDRLQAEIDRLRDEIDTLLADFSDEDFVAAFHDVA